MRMLLTSTPGLGHLHPLRRWRPHPARRPRGGPAGLRALGEFEVLALVRDGLTNAQIAERLFLSRRTVETLLHETGSRNRAALPALVW